MDKKLKHIAYYTKKVRQEMEKARPQYTSTRLPSRSERLLNYKHMLNEYLVK